MNIEELQEKFEQLASTIDWIKTKLVDLQEEKGLAPVKTPYEVEVPEDIDDYYYTNEYGKVDYLEGYNTSYEKNKYIRGLAFKTEEEAEQYDKERILLFKMHKWAEEHNGGWMADWYDCTERKYNVKYDDEDKEFFVDSYYYSCFFTKIPVFKSYGIAQQFIEEFGEQIKEVFFNKKGN